MREKKVAFIVPWFGKLPSYFLVWLKSCEWNNSIDFFVFTDDNSFFNYPPNVHVFYVTFSEIRNRFQKLFSFEICLDSPYKLCDYKPAYGEAFQDILAGYDYWGFCDIDLIWGDISSFIDHILEEQYIRIYTHGHCSLFKNKPEVNRLYRTLHTSKYQSWQDVYKTSESRCFDEWGGHCGGGISYIFEENTIPTYNKVDFADLNFRKGAFYINFIDEFQKDDNSYFCFSNGNLSLCRNGIEKRKFLYITVKYSMLTYSLCCDPFVR